MLDEEEGDKVLNDNKDSFSTKELKLELDELFQDIDTPEIIGIKAYLELLDNRAKKAEKEEFMSNHPEVNWDKIDKNKDGTVGKTNLNKYYSKVQAAYEFEEDSFGYILSNAQALKDEESANNKEIKTLTQDLQDKSVEISKSLTDAQVYELLEEKWIQPVVKGLKELLNKVLNNFENELNATIEKYGSSIKEIENQDKKVSQELQDQLSKLQGKESDITAIKDFIELLGGM